MNHDPSSVNHLGRVALVHDWLVTYAGAERVLEQLLLLFPQADLFAVVDHLPQDERGFLQHKPVTTTFIQRLPRSRQWFRHYLPLMPLAIEQLDLSDYDLVISSSHAVAKGVITSPDTLHVSYIHSPMRYAWDMQHQYLRDAHLQTGIKGWLTRYLLHRLRKWDQLSAQRPDHLIANSHYIARRIDKSWRRPAAVIAPPVDVHHFRYCAEKSDFYLTASRMVSYKRMDIIIQAFAIMPDQQLVVVGDGPERSRLEALAAGCRNISLAGHQPPERLLTYMQQAKAFIFAAEEDFGITPVEAMACGTPVIAYGKGGVCDSVLAQGEAPTGIFFHQQTAQAVIDAVKWHTQNPNYLQPQACRARAEVFAPEQFRRRFLQTVLDYRNAQQS